MIHRILLMIVVAAVFFGIGYVLYQSPQAERLAFLGMELHCEQVTPAYGCREPAFIFCSGEYLLGLFGLRVIRVNKVNISSF